MLLAGWDERFRRAITYRERFRRAITGYNTAACVPRMPLTRAEKGFPLQNPLVRAKTGHILFQSTRGFSSTKPPPPPATELQSSKAGLYEWTRCLGA